MQKFLLAAHSGWRWIVVLAVLAAVIYGLYGWLGGKRWSSTGRKLMLFATTAVDIQLLLGIGLYVTGKYWQSGFPAGTRFEHPTFMILALAAMHVVNARVKKGKNDGRRYQLMALGTLLVVALVVFGISRLPNGVARLYQMSM